MLPFAGFHNEAEFREQFVKPLLNRLGFYGVAKQHGAQEFGKDFVFSELHRFGGVRHYAAQVKHEERITQGKREYRWVAQPSATGVRKTVPATGFSQGVLHLGRVHLQ
jgi:hypothetical protein